MIERDEHDQFWTTTFFVGVDVEMMPGMAIIKGASLSVPFASRGAAEMAQEHIRRTYPEARVFHQTTNSDDYESSYYRQAVENDADIAGFYSEKIDAISASIRPGACA